MEREEGVIARVEKEEVEEVEEGDIRVVVVEEGGSQQMCATAALSLTPKAVGKFGNFYFW